MDRDLSGRAREYRQRAIVFYDLAAATGDADLRRRFCLFAAGWDRVATEVELGIDDKQKSSDKG